MNHTKSPETRLPVHTNSHSGDESLTLLQDALKNSEFLEYRITSACQGNRGCCNIPSASPCPRRHLITYLWVAMNDMFCFFQAQTWKRLKNTCAEPGQVVGAWRCWVRLETGMWRVCYGSISFKLRAEVPRNNPSHFFFYIIWQLPLSYYFHHWKWGLCFSFSVNDELMAIQLQRHWLKKAFYLLEKALFTTLDMHGLIVSWYTLFFKFFIGV